MSELSGRHEVSFFSVPRNTKNQIQKTTHTSKQHKKSQDNETLEATKQTINQTRTDSRCMEENKLSNARVSFIPTFHTPPLFPPNREVDQRPSSPEATTPLAQLKPSAAPALASVFSPSSFSAPSEHWGGSFAAGKTSNTELDSLFQSFLAQEGTTILPCATLIGFTVAVASELQVLLRSTSPIYFPLFTRHHWVAGILRRATDGPVLHIFDSAPSPVVHQDFERIFTHTWPELRLVHHSEWPHQRRFSDDCGIYMAACFFSDMLGIHIPTALFRSLPASLRVLFSKPPSTRAEFLGELRRLFGAAPSSVKETSIFTPAPRSLLRRSSLVGGSDPAHVGGGLVQPSITDIRARVKKVLEVSSSIASGFVPTYLLTAACVACVLQPEQLELNTRQLLNLAGRIQLSTRDPHPESLHDAAEVLQLMREAGVIHSPVHFYGSQAPYEEPSLCDADLALSSQLALVHSPAWHHVSLLYNPLPPRLGHHEFIIGIQLDRMDTTHDSLYPDRFYLTTSSDRAIIGVYCDFGFGQRASTVPVPAPCPPAPTARPISNHFPPDGARAEATRPVKLSASKSKAILGRVSGDPDFIRDPPPFPSAVAPAAAVHTRREPMTSDLQALGRDESLRHLIETHDGSGISAYQQLFREGRYLHQVPVAAQFTLGDLRRILRESPQAQVPKWANEALAESTRVTHRRMLGYLTHITPELDPLPLTTALSQVFTVLRQQRRWTWASTLKNLASLQGALALLPMYFQTHHGILLKQDVLWQQTMQAVQRHAREEIPRTPKTMSLAVFVQTIKRETDPHRAAVLAIQWTTCQRVGCILQLNKEDVKIQTNGALEVTFRRGKGVKLRGPYTVHTAPLGDLLPIFQRIYYQAKTPSSRLFPSIRPADMLKPYRAVDPTLEARSVRRGSLQTLAEQGVPLDLLLRFSGHTNEKTLMRYLGWGTSAGNLRSQMARAGQHLVS